MLPTVFAILILLSVTSADHHLYSDDSDCKAGQKFVGASLPQQLHQHDECYISKNEAIDAMQSLFMVGDPDMKIPKDQSEIDLFCDNIEKHAKKVMNYMNCHPHGSFRHSFGVLGPKALQVKERCKDKDFRRGLLKLGQCVESNKTVKDVHQCGYKLHDAVKYFFEHVDVGNQLQMCCCAFLYMPSCVQNQLKDCGEDVVKFAMQLLFEGSRDVVVTSCPGIHSKEQCNKLYPKHIPEIEKIFNSAEILSPQKFMTPGFEVHHKRGSQLPQFVASPKECGVSKKEAINAMQDLFLVGDTDMIAPKEESHIDEYCDNIAEKAKKVMEHVECLEKGSKHHVFSELGPAAMKARKQRCEDKEFRKGFLKYAECYHKSDIAKDIHQCGYKLHDAIEYALHNISHDHQLQFSCCGMQFVQRCILDQLKKDCSEEVVKFAPRLFFEKTTDIIDASCPGIRSIKQCRQLYPNDIHQLDVIFDSTEKLSPRNFMVPGYELHDRRGPKIPQFINSRKQCRVSRKEAIHAMQSLFLVGDRDMKFPKDEAEVDEFCHNIDKNARKVMNHLNCHDHGSFRHVFGPLAPKVAEFMHNQCKNKEFREGFLKLSQCVHSSDAAQDLHQCGYKLHDAIKYAFDHVDVRNQLQLCCCSFQYMPTCIKNQLKKDCSEDVVKFADHLFFELSKDTVISSCPAISSKEQCLKLYPQHIPQIDKIFQSTEKLSPRRFMALGYEVHHKRHRKLPEYIDDPKECNVSKKEAINAMQHLFLIGDTDMINPKEDTDIDKYCEHVDENAKKVMEHVECLEKGSRHHVFSELGPAALRARHKRCSDKEFRKGFLKYAECYHKSDLAKDVHQCAYKLHDSIQYALSNIDHDHQLQFSCCAMQFVKRCIMEKLKKACGDEVVKFAPRLFFEKTKEIIYASCPGIHSVDQCRQLYPNDIQELDKIFDSTVALTPRNFMVPGYELHDRRDSEIPHFVDPHGVCSVSEKEALEQLQELFLIGDPDMINPREESDIDEYCEKSKENVRKIIKHVECFQPGSKHTAFSSLGPNTIKVIEDRCNDKAFREGYLKYAKCVESSDIARDVHQCAYKLHDALEYSLHNIDHDHQLQFACCAMQYTQRCISTHLRKNCSEEVVTFSSRLFFEKTGDIIKVSCPGVESVFQCRQLYPKETEALDKIFDSNVKLSPRNFLIPGYEIHDRRGAKQPEFVAV